MIEPSCDHVISKWHLGSNHLIRLHTQVIDVNLQGFVEYRTFGSLGQQEGIVALIARRSRLHPGTRYLARGINSCYSTGRSTSLTWCILFTLY